MKKFYTLFTLSLLALKAFAGPASTERESAHTLEEGALCYSDASAFQTGPVY
ncbi:hypothetical protein RCC89_02005 [Cytophagaceae bacterium ABcell3]|nr:hypothetical protein RCC89_02005 [Cytophagaceae bacterium ABcell3]